MLKEKKMKYKVGVMGKAGRSKGIPRSLMLKARKAGEEIAKQNCILITGACMGVPYEAAKGCGEKGGETLAYSPASDLKRHLEPPISYPYPPKGCRLIFTGLGKIGRNVFSIGESDGVIIVGGGMGTTNEFSIAAHEGKVIGILKRTEGASEELLKLFGKIGGKKGASVIADSNPKRLVQKVIEEIKKKKNEEELRKEIPIIFKNQEREQLFGIYHFPVGTYKPPLVILLHGFGETKSNRKFVRLSRALEKEGVAVFRFDFSGCGDSQGKLVNTTVKKWVADLYSATQAVLKEADIDMTRIAIIGHSLGAVVSALFKNQFNFTLKTMIFWAPAFNQKKIFPIWHTPSEIERWKEKGYFIHKDKKMGLKYLSENENKDYSAVLSNFSKINLPILILHSKNDETVPLEFSEKLVKKYKNLKLIKLVSGGHKFEDYNQQRRLIRETTNWIKRYI